jgi:carbon monoxide dehydrogenase subunit G
VEIEKTMVVEAPMGRVWSLLLDPRIMAGCVPGVQSVQVLSDTEYLADIKVKISFISANFKIKTTILETKPPHYLRCEGTGEDSSVASSVKQTSEMFLTEQPDGSTELRVKAKADVFGRLGSFGLSVMKTKADRMWDEFGANIAAILRQNEQGADIDSTTAAKVSPATSGKTFAASSDAAAASHSSVTSRAYAHSSDAPKPGKSKWWSRLVSSSQQNGDTIRDLRLPTDIYVELHRGNDVVKVLWPASAPAEVSVWLKEIMRERSGL